MVEEIQQHIISQDIEQEMKKSYLEYAMSVLVGRALPDVRDGLKPVHRRILHAMNGLNLASTKPTRKSARIVGEVIGKFHPHGDSAVYDSLVRMAQDFSLRYPLVIGQGNFGNIDGDSSAAMRYTEAKLSKLGEALLADIDMETVDFAPNFDEQETEPLVLPGMFPNLLVNGSTGIAVGMATNMAPHNMTEVCKAVLALLDDPNTSDEMLCGVVHGPDFPTGGIIIGRSGIRSAYMTGRGKIIVRCRAHLEESGARQSLIITEIPYMIRKEELLIEIDNCRKDKIIPDISVVRDESDRDGMRIVIELKANAQHDLVLNQLYRHTRLQSTFGIINLCLVDGIPKVLTLKELVSEFIKHRQIVVVRRTQYELRKTQEKAHLLLGLKKAIEQLDKTIAIIRAAKEGKEAKEQLKTFLAIDDIQAQAIMEMRLQRLTGLERDKIVAEYKELIAHITELEGILADPKKVIAILQRETQQIIAQFGDNRKSEIIDGEADVEDEALIPDELAVVTITNTGFIKRVHIDTYRAQARGGKGIIGATVREEDIVDDVFTARTKSYLLCFSNKGQLYWLKVYKIPEATRTASGRSIVNLLPLTDGEKITTYIPVDTFPEDKYLVIVTKQGTIKKMSLSYFANPRSTGIRAVTLDEGDELISAGLTDGNKEIMVATRDGLAARFHEEDVRPMGRTAAGVRGIRLEDGDAVVSMIIPEAGETVLTVTEHGFGKRTPVSEYRLIGRGGKGVINIQTSERNGKVVACRPVTDEQGIILISKKGIVIRTRADQISVIGRNTQGVRLMRLDDADIVSGVAKIHGQPSINGNVER